jgi:hypothetical protein
MGTIQSAIGLHCLGDQGLYFDGFRDVGFDEDRLTTLFCDHMDGLVSTVCVQVSHNQFRPFPSKRQGGGSPNP